MLDKLAKPHDSQNGLAKVMTLSRALGLDDESSGLIRSLAGVGGREA